MSKILNNRNNIIKSKSLYIETNKKIEYIIDTNVLIYTSLALFFMICLGSFGFFSMIDYIDSVHLWFYSSDLFIINGEQIFSENNDFRSLGNIDISSIPEILDAHILKTKAVLFFILSELSIYLGIGFYLHKNMKLDNDENTSSGGFTFVICFFLAVISLFTLIAFPFLSNGVNYGVLIFGVFFIKVLGFLFIVIGHLFDRNKNIKIEKNENIYSLLNKRSEQEAIYDNAINIERLIFKDETAMYEALEDIKGKNMTKKDLNYIKSIFKKLEEYKKEESDNIKLHDRLLGIANEKFDNESIYELEIKNT